MAAPTPHTIRVTREDNGPLGNGILLTLEAADGQSGYRMKLSEEEAESLQRELREVLAGAADDGCPI